VYAPARAELQEKPGRCVSRRPHPPGDPSPGVELASGVHWFLKERCNSSVAWAATGGNQLDLACLAPAALAAPAAGRPLYRGRSVPYHYYQNAVTPRRAHRVRYPIMPYARALDTLS